MKLLKRLIFVLPFLFSFGWFTLQLEYFLQTPNLIFSLDLSVLVQLITLALAILLSSYFFIIFSTLAADLKIVLPVALVNSVSTMAILTSQQNYLLALGFFLSFSLISLFLIKTLTTYVDFRPTSLLSPHIKRLATLIILVSTLGFYFSSVSDISKNDFKIPDSLIDSVLKLSPTSQIPDLPTSQISPQQLEMLKQNPALLQQFNIDPNSLDTLTGQTTPTQDPVKAMVTSQFQSMVKPYLNFIPPFLAILFFFTLQSLVSLLGIILPGLVWFIFYLLEKTGFVKFEEEQRVIKKMLV